MDKTSAIDRAIEILGSQRELADRLGVRTQAITKWRKRQRVPAERVLGIEHATGGEVSRSDLRPDIYPTDTAA